MEVKADGTWRSVDSYSTLYGTADGKVYQEKPGQEKREVGKELTPTTVPVNPIAYAEGGVGGNSVVPLKPRTPLNQGRRLSNLEPLSVVRWRIQILRLGCATLFVSKMPFYLELCWKKYGNVLYIR